MPRAVKSEFEHVSRNEEAMKADLVVDGVSSYLATWESLRPEWGITLGTAVWDCSGCNALSLPLVRVTSMDS